MGREGVGACRGEVCILHRLARDGGGVVVRGNDDLICVGTCQHCVEEGIGVCEAILRNHSGVCHKAISPAHGKSQLAAALNKEQRCRRHLQTTSADTHTHKS